MILRGKIEYKNAIQVDEKLLRELESIILEFFKEVGYLCILCNGDIINFDSLDELLDYENTKTRKITIMSIKYGYYNEIVFKCRNSLFFSYGYTVEGTYRMDNSDSSILFSEKIKNALDKNKQSNWYTIITKISLIQVCAVLFILSLGNIIYGHAIGVHSNLTYTVEIVNLQIAIALIMMGLSIFLAKCRNMLLPPIAYKIGEQTKEIEKRRDLFSKIFWGVIVAFVVSIITSLII